MKLSKIKAIIFDMDGVLWHAYHPIGDLPKIFARLQDLGIKYVFASNNGTIHVDQYVEKICKLNIPVSHDQIFTSSKVTGEVLKSRFPNGGNVYVVGEKGLKRTIEEKGFSINSENAIAVVAGLDFEITYEKIEIAANLARSGLTYLATNPDATYPTTEGLSPGAGSIIASVSIASGKDPEFIGKPQPTMFLQALSYLKVKPEQALVIGDRLETDIAGGQAAGCMTAAVLSGVSNRESAETWRPKIDIIAEDVTEIVGML
jgi:4-nitrophenyl phosphatase